MACCHANAFLSRSEIIWPRLKISKMSKIAFLAEAPGVRASSYEPGNRAGSVTGTNSLVCS